MSRRPTPDLHIGHVELHQQAHDLAHKLILKEDCAESRTFVENLVRLGVVEEGFRPLRLTNFVDLLVGKWWSQDPRVTLDLSLARVLFSE